ncbi:hypothetical protein D3C86_1934710 [compost metagenome]
MFRNAYSGICNAELQRYFIFLLCAYSNKQFNRTFNGKFKCIVQQVQQDLGKPVLISCQVGRHITFYAKAEF